MGVQVAKLHPRYKGEYFAFPQNDIDEFASDFFHIRGNHKTKEITLILTIIHMKIIKMINKTSV